MTVALDQRRGTLRCRVVGLRNVEPGPEPARRYGMQVTLFDLGEPDYGHCSVCGAWCRGERVRMGIELLSLEVLLCHDCLTSQGTRSATRAVEHILRRGSETVEIVRLTDAGGS